LVLSVGAHFPMIPWAHQSRLQVKGLALCIYTAVYIREHAMLALANLLECGALPHDAVRPRQVHCFYAAWSSIVQSAGIQWGAHFP
jgi:hypothetical protein